MHHPKKNIQCIIIMRALPGSGKSSLSKVIADSFAKYGIQCLVHSTDDIFLKQNQSVFDAEKLAQYHEMNLANFRESVLQGTPCVICDNTNLWYKYTEPYLMLSYNKPVLRVLIVLQPESLSTHHKRTVHKMSLTVLERMKNIYESSFSTEKFDKVISISPSEFETMKRNLPQILSEYIYD